MKRVYCPHCNENVSRSTLYNHRILFQERVSEENTNAVNNSLGSGGDNVIPDKATNQEDEADNVENDGVYRHNDIIEETVEDEENQQDNDDNFMNEEYDDDEIEEVNQQENQQGLQINIYKDSLCAN